MKYYFAPMEGITGFIYRNAYEKFFGHIDKYFTPFISPNQNHKFSAKEMKDIMPEHNEGIHLVPQILSNRSDYFIWTARELKQLGYEEVNLNLGCPSATVVSKGRGSGFLAYPEELDHFLYEIYDQLDMKISIKTRIGKREPEESYHLMEIYNQYPLSELIIHPRLQTDHYNNTPNLTVFREALNVSKCPVCYNGDLFTASAYQSFCREFDEVDTVMMGRGLIGNPGLLPFITEEKMLKKDLFKQFHDTIVEEYRKDFSGDRNVLFKMKELWYYMIHLFGDSDTYGKKIRKSEKLSEYQAAVDSLLRELELSA